MSRWNTNEACTSDIREALYFMSQNYKFVRLETIRPRAEAKFTPFFSFVFEGEGVRNAQQRYGNDSCHVDPLKLKVLAAEIESYMKNVEDYSI